MKLLRLIPPNTNFDFLHYKKIAFLFSTVIIIGTFLSLFINNLNYGIDFKGGILLELRSKDLNSANIDELRTKISKLNAGEVSIQNFGKETDFLVRRKECTTYRIYFVFLSLSNLPISLS